MVESDERSPLLQNEQGQVIIGDEEAVAVEVQDSAVPKALYDSGAALRRYSSVASLPPHHEQHPASKAPSSTFAIWTVIPILLLGKVVDLTSVEHLLTTLQVS